MTHPLDGGAIELRAARLHDNDFRNRVVRAFVSAG
jgi:hypothetical protein